MGSNTISEIFVKTRLFNVSFILSYSNIYMFSSGYFMCAYPILTRIIQETPLYILEDLLSSREMSRIKLHVLHYLKKEILSNKRFKINVLCNHVT